MMRVKVYIVLCVLLVPLSVGAINYPKYSGGGASVSSYASRPSLRSSGMEDNAFGSYTLADEHYNTHCVTQLASDPYGEPAASSSPYRASRPGGGTGVIPNQAPIGDLLPLVLLSLLYGCWMWYRKKLQSK